MPGRSSAERDALTRQNAAIMAVFERAGFDHIAPDIIQPADIFLERSGEDIRARTFLFTDPDGNELCLRPDLTVPACRYHLTHAAEAEARYCYLGQAFRFPDEKLSPQEFTQAGIEWFGGSDPVTEEARILKLAISALEATGLSKLKVTIGDLGLFNALLADMPMPERWRRRLMHQFWRPQAFQKLLDRFSANATANTSRQRTAISDTIDALAKADPLSVVHSTLTASGIPHLGERSLDDVAARLAEKFADRSQAPLDPDMVQRITAYLALEGTLADQVKHLQAMATADVNGGAFAGAVEAFITRIDALEDLGLNPRRFLFDANFGRELEYYTGFVFQVEANAGNHPITVAGGGRYDDLLRDLGAKAKIPAVGCAIHTERVTMVL